jgi:AraC-like DNA-binding protein
MAPLRTIVERGGIAVTACLRQRTEMFLTSLTAERPSVVVVREGIKRIRCGGEEHTLTAGDAVAIAGGLTLDVVNTPSPDGWYEAQWLMFTPGLLERFATGRPGLAPVRGCLSLSPVERGFRQAFERAVEGVLAPATVPEAVAEERAREVLAWLAARGGRLTGAGLETVAARVRDHLDREPDRVWTASAMARALGMSEATMRRRLAAEGQSLTRIQTDRRMSRALFLLQATDQPIIQIAFDVGYESASRFAARFRERFGHPPSAVRGEAADFERFGTPVERSGGVGAAPP